MKLIEIEILKNRGFILQLSPNTFVLHLKLEPKNIPTKLNMSTLPLQARRGFPTSEFRERVQKAQEKMEEAGVDALFLTTEVGFLLLFFFKLLFFFSNL